MAKAASMRKAKQTTQVAFRLPTELLERVDRFKQALAERTPGIDPSRADAVRILLTHALSSHEAQREKTARLGKPPRVRHAK